MVALTVVMYCRYCYNVIPSQAAAGFDIRLPPHVLHTEFHKKLQEWCKNAGDDVTFEFVEGEIAINNPSDIDPNKSIWCVGGCVIVWGSRCCVRD